MVRGMIRIILCCLGLVLPAIAAQAQQSVPLKVMS